MKLLIFIWLSFFSLSAFCLSPKTPGEIILSKERRIKNDHWNVVPKCKRWMLQDIRNFGEQLWVEIDGTLQLMEDYRDHDGLSYYMNGRFTFSTSNFNQYMSAVLLEGTKVHLRSVSEEASTGIYEFEYWFPSDKCKD